MLMRSQPHNFPSVKQNEDIRIHFALWALSENSRGCENLQRWLVGGCRCEECFAEGRSAKFEQVGRSTVRPLALEIV